MAADGADSPAADEEIRSDSGWIMRQTEHRLGLAADLDHIKHQGSSLRTLFVTRFNGAHSSTTYVVSIPTCPAARQLDAVAPGETGPSQR